MDDDYPNREHKLVQSFFIDTEGYTDRDREMFVCGYEFCMIYELLNENPPWSRMIHTENASRIRMMIGKRGLYCEINQHPEMPEWSELIVFLHPPS